MTGNHHPTLPEIAVQVAAFALERHRHFDVGSAALSRRNIDPLDVRERDMNGGGQGRAAFPIVDTSMWIPTGTGHTRLPSGEKRSLRSLRRAVKLSNAIGLFDRRGSVVLCEILRVAA